MSFPVFASKKVVLTFSDVFLFLFQGAFELISSQCPKAVAGMLDGMARRLSAASAARSNPNQSALDPPVTHLYHVSQTVILGCADAQSPGYR